MCSSADSKRRYTRRLDTKTVLFFPRAQHKSKSPACVVIAGFRGYVRKFPNISGVLYGALLGVNPSATGALGISSLQEYNVAAATVSDPEKMANESLDASRTSSVYSDTETVQPASCRCLVLIRSY